MKKIILASALAFAFLAANVEASEDVFVNDYISIETYPEGSVVKNDLKKEKEYLKGIFDFDFDLETSYEFSNKDGEKLIFIQKIVS